MEQFFVALFLATVNKALVDYFAAPLRQKYPTADMWWLVYVALATGAIIGWFADLNLFTTYIANPLAGRLLTAIFVGGGSSLLHDVFDKTSDEDPFHRRTR